MNIPEAYEVVRAWAQDTAKQMGMLARERARELLVEGTFEDFELLVLAMSNEGSREALREELQESSESYGEAVCVNGREYIEHEPGTVAYGSLSGPIQVTRWTYRQTGVHNGPTVVPLELECGLVEHATPAMAKAITLGYAKHDLRSYAEDLETAHRVPPSRATMERIARKIGEQAHQEAPRIEKVLRRTEKLPEGAHGISIGLDRGSTPMAEERPEGQSPATRRRERTEPYKRTPPAPFDVNWRMAPVATVTITDQNGEALVTRRYGTTQQDGWDGIVKRAMADVDAALQRDPNLVVGVVQDGAHELWTLTREALATVPRVTSYVEAIDRYHLSERLGTVLQIIEPDAKKRRAMEDRWQGDLDTDYGAIDRIEKEIILAYKRLKVRDKETIWEHLVYLRNNKDRMRYVNQRLRGLPLGSGATESACNTLLNLRVKRNAEHWSNPGLRGVLTIRGIYQSGRFDPFWRHLSHQYRAHITPINRAA